MSVAVGYSDSDSDSDSDDSNKRRKVASPPTDVLQRFSKVPLRMHRRNSRAGESTEREEVTFVYVPVVPDARLMSEISTLLEDVRRTLLSNCGLSERDLQLQNLSINELTRGAGTLHVSLGYNMTLPGSQLDAFISETQTAAPIDDDSFPLALRFEEGVHLLYNDDRSRVFVALRLAAASLSVLRPLVEHLNTHVCSSPAARGADYDPSVLHLSVAVLPAPAVALPAILPFPTPASWAPVRADGVELSRGRSVLKLLPRRSARLSSRRASAATVTGRTRAEHRVAKERHKDGGGGKAAGGREGGGGGSSRKRPLTSEKTHNTH